MRYSIATTKKRYRGMERCLTVADLYTKQTRKKFDELLDKYYQYLSEIEEIPSKSGLAKLMDFCMELDKNGIQCEIIAFDMHPLETVFGYPLDFLGFDLVWDMAESLISEGTNRRAMPFLNENGLCNSISDAKHIMQFLDQGDVKWEPCYVYKVIYNAQSAVESK